MSLRLVKAIRNLTHRPAPSGLEALGDFTTTRRVIGLSVLAIGIGVVSAYVAFALLRLIGLFTNLFFFQRWGTALVSPAANTLGLWEVAVPVAGALLIFSLMIGPPAAARSVTSRPPVALLLSVAVALVTAVPAQAPAVLPE